MAGEFLSDQNSTFHLNGLPTESCKLSSQSYVKKIPKGEPLRINKMFLKLLILEAESYRCTCNKLVVTCIIIDSE